MLNSWPVLSYGLEHFDQRISDKSQLRSLVQTKLLRWSNCVEHNCPRRVETYVLLANFSRDFIFCQWMLAHASLKSINVPMHLTQTSITTDASPIAVPEAASTATPKLQAKWVGLQELRVHKKAWDALAENALWRNASFESNYLLPALEHLATESVRVMVVERFAANNQSCLVAVVPFVEKRVYRLPFKAIEVWKHDQSFDATPLLSKNFAPFAWQSICEKLIADKYVLLSLDTVLAESRLDLVLRNAETKLGIVRFQRDHFQRAAFTPDQTVESYTKKHVSKSLRKNTGRLLRRLEDIGTVDSLPKTFYESRHPGGKGRKELLCFRKIRRAPFTDGWYMKVHSPGKRDS